MACASGSTLAPMTPANSPSANGPKNGANAGGPAQPGQGSGPTATAPANGQPSGSAPLSLQIQSPQDGAIVNSPQINVSGTASPGEVVSVNDSVIVVGADGKFNAAISLDQGPNLIEVVASNDTGNQTSIELTVIYEP